MAPLSSIHPEEHLSRRKLRILYICSFLMGIASALTAYIESSFLRQFVGEQYLGIVFAIAYFILFLIILYNTFLIAKVGKYWTTILILFLCISSLVILSTSQAPELAVAVFIVFLITIFLLGIIFDIYIEQYSKDVVTGEIRGSQLTITNAGWVLAPAIAGFILYLYGFASLFFLAALLTLLILIIFVNFFPKEGELPQARPDLARTFSVVWQNRSLRSIFSIAFLLHFFYAWMVIYTPLYLRDLGFDWREIGQMFTLMLLPFVIFQYPAGKLADRYHSEKLFLGIGFLFMAVAVFLIFYFQSNNFWQWAILLFASRIGASLVEVMRDTYFYKQISAKDVDMINLFRSTGPLAYGAAPLIASGLLGIINLPTIFLLLAVLLLSGFYFVHNLEKTR